MLEKIEHIPILIQSLQSPCPSINNNEPTYEEVKNAIKNNLKNNKASRDSEAELFKIAYFLPEFNHKFFSFMKEVFREKKNFKLHQEGNERTSLFNLLLDYALHIYTDVMNVP